MTKGLPDLGRELGPTIGDYVHGNTMESNHVGHKKVRSLSRGREFREGGEVNHLREPVDDGQDGGIALGRGKSSHKVQGDVRPRSTGDGEGPEQSRRGSVGRLAPGRREVQDELAGPGHPGMTGQLAGVAPNEDPAADGLGDEETIRRAYGRDRFGTLGRFEAPGDDTDNPGGRYDGGRVRVLRGMLTLMDP